MNSVTKEIIVAVHNNNIVYADSNFNSFVRGMKAIEPNIYGRLTLKKKLKDDGVAYFTGKLGTHYAIYYYENPNYKGFQ